MADTLKNNKLSHSNVSDGSDDIDEESNETTGRICLEKRSIQAAPIEYLEKVNPLRIEPRNLKKGKVLVTGGGAYHDFLIGRIKELNPDLEIFIPSDELIEYKEALIFALLGKLRLANEVNCLASVTGARKDHSSGEVCGS